MKVVFYEAFIEERNLLEEMLLADWNVRFYGETIQEVAEECQPVDVVSIRTQSIVPCSWASTIRGVLSRSTGFDHLTNFQKRCANRGAKVIPCGYLDEYSTKAVAEHAIIMLLCLMRKFPQQMRQFMVFDRDHLTGIESAGKNLLVFGIGRIGSEICRIAKSFGFEVKGVDIVHNNSEVAYVPQEIGIPWADAIVCAMDLNESNLGYFSYDRLKNLTRGCFLVNVARGEMTPLADLKRLLDERLLLGLGLDVFENESDLAVSLRNNGLHSDGSCDVLAQLIDYPNVILTPHNAFNSREALRRKAQLSVEQLITFS